VKLMKRIAALTLILIILLPAACAWSESKDAQTDNALPSEGTPRYIIADDVYYEVGDSFFKTSFYGDMQAVKYSDSVGELVFNPASPERLLPNLYVTVPAFEMDEESIKDTIRFILEVTNYLQDHFPESNLFNVKMMADRADAGLGYMVAEQNIWLRPTTYPAALIPVCFYNDGNGDIFDGIYLLEVTPTAEGDFRCTLYNEPKHLAIYMAYVTIESSGSPFQLALAQWYLRYVYLENWNDHVTGYARIISSMGYVCDTDHVSARVLARVPVGEELPVLDESSNGWYWVRYEEGKFGYISPKGVEFIPKE